MSYPTISDDPTTQTLYEEIREAGTEHKLAEMLALRQGPCLSTDTRFQANRSGDPFEGVPERFKPLYAARARAGGVNPEGKYYSGILARYPGDPRALVSTRGDVRRVAEQRGIGVECGPVKTKAREIVVEEPTGPYKAAPDLVEREVQKEIAAAGEKPTPQEKAELFEKTQQRLSGNQD